MSTSAPNRRSTALGPAGDPQQVRDAVRSYYAAAARTALETQRASCCGDQPASRASSGGPVLATDDLRFGPARYDPAELAELPAGAVTASLGCGNPLALADLHPGETVLDLGSGGGIDVLLAAARVGPDGRAIGLDMTTEMLGLARRNAAEVGVANAEFVLGTIEAMPLPDASIDVAVSNCVLNLSPDKGQVFAELARVLRPGGRLAISDVVADDRLSPPDRAARGGYESCIAGALSFGEYAAGLAAAGLAAIELVPTHAISEGFYGAIVRAVRPGAGVLPDDPARAAVVAAAALAIARQLPAAGEPGPLGDAFAAPETCCCR